MQLTEAGGSSRFNNQTCLRRKSYGHDSVNTEANTQDLHVRLSSRDTTRIVVASWNFNG